MENQAEKKDKSFVFWAAMLVALFIGIVGIFAVLDRAVPKGLEDSSGSWNLILSKDGGPTAYSMRLLGDKDRHSGDVKRWITASGDYIAQDLGGDARDTVFWLYRQDSDEYVLYLPEQERVLGGLDVTANEEKDPDGSVRLVLRIRTPENAAEIDPKEQLLSFMTESAKWNGIRVTVILDGREQQVRIMTSQGEELYTTEQSYIGRS